MKYGIRNFITSRSSLTPAQPGRLGQHKKKMAFLTLCGGGLAYDGVMNEFSVTQGAERFLRSAKTAVSISLDYNISLWNAKEGDPGYEELRKEVHLRSAHKLLNACLANGGLYIKIGQGFSAINHILPEEYTKTLSQLHDKCLPRKKDEVREIFIQDFGKAPEEMYKEFNYEPIAAASLAQVFEAVTHDGEKVAVKVQYVDLQKRFNGDFGTILFLQDLIELVHKNYNFGWIVKSVRRNLEQELDFINEGNNAEKCARDLSKLPFVYVPKVNWKLTTKRILTTEFIDACKASDLKAIKAMNLNLSDVDRKIFQAFSEQIFRSGFVHGDPHPGNVFIRQGKDKKAEVVLLDHGLYETLPNDIRDALCHFWEAIVLMDHDAMKRHAAKMNVKDYFKFAEILLQRPLETKNKFSTKLTESEIAYMQKLARKRFDIIMNTLREMPQNMLFIVRNLNTVRAIAREHGDPIDRPRVMAQHAVSCIHHGRGIVSMVAYAFRRMRFEVQLWRMTFRYWFAKNYLLMLAKVGRAPPTVNNIFRQEEL